MNFGFVGVSGSGKTTLFEEVVKKFGSKVNGLPEVRVEDFQNRFGWGKGEINFNDSYNNLQVNLGLLDIQKEAEKKAIGSIHAVADSCSLAKLTFYLFLAAQFDDSWKVDAYVKDTIELTKRFYKVLFYLPFDPKRERIRPHPFRSEWMLRSMDSILRELLFETDLEIHTEIIELPRIESGLRERFMLAVLKERGLEP